MSFSFDKLPKSMDTVMFRRERFASGPPVELGWVVVLDRAATLAESRWLSDNGFVYFGRDPNKGGKWKRADRPNDFR